jgi:hypothetical protein
VVYVLVLEELDREFHAAQLQVAVARGMGAEVDIPSWQEVKADFHAYLVSEPEPVDVAKQTQLMALGLR